MKRGEADAAARRVPLVLAVGAIGTAVCAAGLVACSVLLDWSGFTSADGSEGGHMMHMMSGDDAADGPGDSPPDDGGIFADAPPLTNCGGGGLCSPPIPNAPGWSGPYSLSAGAPGSLPACDTQSYLSQPAFEGNYGLNAATPQCGCSCSAPSGLSCNPPNVTFFPDTTCDASCGGPAVPISGCTAIPNCALNLQIGPPTQADAGACTPNASTTILPSTWTGAARVCGLRPGASHSGCSAEEYCLPATTPFCIEFVGDAGDMQCPAASLYAHRHVFYRGVDDQRGCTSCTCGAPTGAVCSFPPASLPVGSFGPACSFPSGMPFFVPAQCTGRVPSALGLQMIFDAGIEGGSCQPSAVAPLDAGAVPTGATTLCCTQ